MQLHEQEWKLEKQENVSMVKMYVNMEKYFIFVIIAQQSTKLR